MCWWSSIRDSGVKSVFSCQYLKWENVNKLINIIIYKRMTEKEERKIEKINEWMNACMNELMNEEINELLTDWLDESMNKWKWSDGGKKGKEILGSLEVDWFFLGIWNVEINLPTLYSWKLKKLFRTLCNVTCKQWNYSFSVTWKDMLP